MLEARIPVFPDILLHAEAGQSDSEKRALRAELLHKLDSAAGEAIADQNIELFLAAQLKRALKTCG